MSNNKLFLIAGLIVVLAGLIIFYPSESDSLEDVVINDSFQISEIDPKLVKLPTVEANVSVELPVIEVLDENEVETVVEIIVENNAEALEVETTALLTEPTPPPLQLPELNHSDDFIRAQLAEFPVGTQLLALLVPEELIRKFVLFTDSVSQGFLSQDIPLNFSPSPILVKRVSAMEVFEMEAQSYTRFDSLIATFIAIDVNQTLELYKLLLPLFQQAYEEIGYPNKSFEEALQQALSIVLSAPKSDTPLELIRPSVMYLYADNELEELNQVEKLLLRLGPDNVEKLEQKLRALQLRIEH